MQCFSCMVMFATYLRKRSGTLIFWLSQSRHITFASALILCLGEKNSVEPAMRITEAIIEWPVDRDSQVPRMAFGTSTDNQKADKQAASLSIPNQIGQKFQQNAAMMPWVVLYRHRCGLTAVLTAVLMPWKLPQCCCQTLRNLRRMHMDFQKSSPHLCILLSAAAMESCDHWHRFPRY